jgi:hypothetical protein
MDGWEMKLTLRSAVVVGSLGFVRRGPIGGRVMVLRHLYLGTSSLLMVVPKLNFIFLLQ